MDELRIDKWLWAARFFKTRSLAQDAVDNGRVLVEGERVKVAHALRPGRRVTVRVGDSEQVVLVRGLSDQRRGAPEARLLYEETAESMQARQAQRERRRLFTEPAAALHGRPTKRDRRRIDDLSDG